GAPHHRSVLSPFHYAGDLMQRLIRERDADSLGFRSRLNLNRLGFGNADNARIERRGKTLLFQTAHLLGAYLPSDHADEIFSVRQAVDAVHAAVVGLFLFRKERRHHAVFPAEEHDATVNDGFFVGVRDGAADRAGADGANFATHRIFPIDGDSRLVNVSVTADTKLVDDER